MKTVISPHRQALLIKAVLNGKSVSRTCRDANISRTIFYRWWKQYNTEHISDAPPEVRRKKKWNPRTVTARIQQKIVAAVVKNPSFTIRQLAADTGLSTKAVWQTLQSRQLQTVQLREQFAAAYSPRPQQVTPFDRKVSLLRRFSEGEKISRLCQEAGISRTVFYRWLQLYKQSGEERFAVLSARPCRDRHYRFNKAMEESVLLVVKTHPEYSLNQILSFIATSEHAVFSRSGVYKVLKRFALTTTQDRLAYARTRDITDNQPYIQSDQTLPPIPQYSFVSFLSPPVKAYILLLHTLCFELFYPHLSSPYSCSICVYLNNPSALKIFDSDEQRKEVCDDE